MSNPPQLEEEVQAIVRVTSEKYICASNKDHVLSDLLLDLKRFRNAVRWKELFQRAKIKKASSPTSVTNFKDFNSEECNEFDYDFKKRDAGGLGTFLKSTKLKHAPRGSDETEFFLKEVERTLLDNFNNSLDVKLTKKAKEIKALERKFSASSKVVVPTDKTNLFLTIELEVYVRWMMENLEGTATAIEHERLTEIMKEAEKLLASRRT